MQGMRVAIFSLSWMIKTMWKVGFLACFTCGLSLALGQGPSVEDTARHWAFQSISEPVPPLVTNAGTSIDSFLAAKQRSHQLRSAETVSSRLLLRRLAFGLKGLPATHDETLAFERDDRPDALARQVDKMLASPRFGERWGRHWLDLARYADTKGYLVGGASRRYPFAYSYRDWVIGSLNAGMPYDEFVRKQLAADLLRNAPAHPDLAALGFLTVGPRFLNREHLIIDDCIDVVTRGLMGFTVGCARCHDHFYDPIPQEDYYSLYGIFDLVKEPKELPVISLPDPSSPSYRDYTSKLKTLEKAVAEHLRSKWNYLRSEQGIRAYMQAAHDGFSLSNDRLEALAAKRKLYPKLVIRWRDFLRKKETSDDRLFAPWRAFREAKPSSYSSIVANWLSNSREIPPFLERELRKGTPKDFTQVSSWYSREFAGALAKSFVGQSSKATATLVATPAFPVSFELSAVERYFDTAARNKTNALRAKVAKHQADHPGSPTRAMAIVDVSTFHNPRIFERGNPNNRGREVPRRFLAALSPAGTRKPYVNGSGRLELADSILSKSNPLTARVFVNRVWEQMIGEGIVRTPSDFGLRGAPPTHPLLLDYLASTFREDSWDLKRLVRRISLSEAYRQSCGSPPARDPENRLLSVMNRQRLDFESMRDAMLFASGEIDLSIGGRSVHLIKKPFSVRRAVYGYVDRQNIPALLRTFDFSNPNIHTPARPETTVPQQALFALNDPFVIGRAEALGRALVGFAPEKAIQALYRRVLSRDPSAQELATAHAFLGGESSLEGLADLAQALLVSNEFFFID